MTKMERLSADAISKMPAAVEKLKNAAAGSEAAARETRARVRRQRITSQQNFPSVRPAEEAEALSMPDTWRDDEPTAKTTLPDDAKHEKIEKK